MSLVLAVLAYRVLKSFNLWNEQQQLARATLTDATYGNGKYCQNHHISSKRVFRENKARQIFRKTNISYLVIQNKARQILRKTNTSYPLIRTCTYHRVKNVRFSENLACFVFLKHPFWDWPFCHITDDLVETKIEHSTLYSNYSYSNWGRFNNNRRGGNNYSNRGSRQQ